MNVTAGSGQVKYVALPRHRASFTAYVANEDKSSTCIIVECEHAHDQYTAALRCLERLRYRVEHRPMSVPAVAEELRRREPQVAAP